jgi:hypothetical protein
MDDFRVANGAAINGGIALLYIFASSFLLQNHSGGADIAFVGFVLTGFLIHLVALLLLLVKGRIYKDTSWQNALGGLGAVLVIALFFGIYIGAGNPKYTPSNDVSTADYAEMSLPDSLRASILTKIVDEQGKVGFVNDQNKTVIPCLYDATYGFENIYSNPLYDTVAAVKKAGKWGFINAKGRVIVPFYYDQVIRFNKALAAVSKDSLWGYIDRSGKVVVPLQYEKANSFWYGLAAVKTKGLWGYINQEGKFIINPVFKAASDFESGEARITIGEAGVSVSNTNSRMTSRV